MPPRSRWPGPSRHVATGETVTLDGGRSYDVDVPAPTSKHKPRPNRGLFPGIPLASPIFAANGQAFPHRICDGRVSRPS